MVKELHDGPPESPEVVGERCGVDEVHGDDEAGVYMGGGETAIGDEVTMRSLCMLAITGNKSRC